MKPKTKMQQRIAKLSQQLPVITNEQKTWAFANCLKHVARRLKKGTTCIDCGHTWQENSNQVCTCPACGQRLKIEDTKKQKFEEMEYMLIYTTCEEFQVLRFFSVQVFGRVGQKARYLCREVVQHWIAPSGKHEVMARLRRQHIFYYDLWDYSSDIEIRHLKPAHNIASFNAYPQKIYIPELQRAGFNGKCHGLTHLDTVKLLLSNSQAETLLKAKQYSLFAYTNNHSGAAVNKHWPSIKICLRNNYVIKDASMWIDYLRILEQFGKDLRSPKYVCPADLRKEHDRYVEKERRHREKLRVIESMQKATEAEEQYQKDKKKFFDIEFSDGEIFVSVLKSVAEFIKEGDILRHCVFASGYYSKKDSLILTASVDGQKTETIEVSLSEMKVTQCRGVNNRNTEYHGRIINLVEKNMKLIKQKMAA